MYTCLTVARTEPIPVCKYPNLSPLLLSIVVKPKSENVPQRVFNKETSVFKMWKNETKKQKTLSLESDFALWKVPRIVKSESEI